MSDMKSNRLVFARDRRRFLMTALGSSVFAASAGWRFATAASGELSKRLEELSVLRADEARVLLQLARTLFPHEFLDDGYYAQAVKQLDSMASRDASRARLIKDGLRQLPDNFIDLEQSARETALTELQHDAFFKLARRATVSAVYRDPDVWPHFGYPGPSLAFGGWVTRELVDIDWLPAVKTG